MIVEPFRLRNDLNAFGTRDRPDNEYFSVSWLLFYFRCLRKDNRVLEMLDLLYFDFFADWDIRNKPLSFLDLQCLKPSRSELFLDCYAASEDDLLGSTRTPVLLTFYHLA